MESACSLSSTHRIVLFGRIFLSPWDFSVADRRKAFTEVFTAGCLLLWFRNFTAIEAGKQVTETPTSGKLCGELSSGRNRDRKARKKNSLLPRFSKK